MLQQEFWKSEFGDNYIQRNSSELLLSANTVFFSQIFQQCQVRPASVLELGANIGMNLRVLKTILPDAKLSGVEVNTQAFNELTKVADQAYNIAIEEFQPSDTYDFVFTKGVLIHVSPETLEQVYRSLAQLSSKHVMFAEYFSRETTEISYRGHNKVLFKRDFLNEFLDINGKDKWSLRNYGFVSRFDCFPQDDLNWYLLERI